MAQHYYNKQHNNKNKQPMKCSIPLSFLFFFCLSTLVSSSFVDVETDAGYDEKTKRALIVAGQEGPSLRQRMLSTEAKAAKTETQSVATKAEKERQSDAKAEKQSVDTKAGRKRMLRND